MTSEKQLLANLKNAKLSTGPTTIEGKEIISTNAIKHGIFTKDLIIASGAGQENQEEYEGLLTNLIQSLSPRNQIESLLVEKIAVDFWRLRRTIRFETGSINKNIERIIFSHYSSRASNDALDSRVKQAEEQISWNVSYLKYLKRNEVSFKNPIWEGRTVVSDISEDFFLIARSLPDLTRPERDLLYEKEWTFEELAVLLAQHGYSQDEQITTRLIEIYLKENEKLKKDLEKLRQEKIHNQEEDLRNTMIGSIPVEENAEKALKYERSIQKSIFQNLFLLKKLQGVF